MKKNVPKEAKTLKDNFPYYFAEYLFFKGLKSERTFDEALIKLLREADPTLVTQLARELKFGDDA